MAILGSFISPENEENIATYINFKDVKIIDNKIVEFELNAYLDKESRLSHPSLKVFSFKAYIELDYISDIDLATKEIYLYHKEQMQEVEDEL